MLGFHPVSGALKSVSVLFSFLLLWNREVLCEVAFVASVLVSPCFNSRLDSEFE